MDSISQAALGGAIGEVVLGKKIGNKGAVLGAVIATIPDLDIVLVPFFTDVQRISLHRGYSHSILFAILGAIAIALLFKRINWTKDIAFTRLWLFSFLTLFTHMLLDAFTSYGTLLYLPLSEKRVSFDSIGIVDPVYTLPLLSGLIVSLLLKRGSVKRRWWNYGGLFISSLYLAFTLVNKQMVERVFAKSLEDQTIQIQKMLTVPVSIGNALWYCAGKSDEGLYIGNYSVFDKSKSIDFEFFPSNDTLLKGLDPVLVDRMIWFAKDFYHVVENNGRIRFYNMQVDMQGIQHDEYMAPTAWYFEIIPGKDGSYVLSSGLHSNRPGKLKKLNRTFYGN